jgi:hypothetical protein
LPERVLRRLGIHDRIVVRDGWGHRIEERCLRLRLDSLSSAAIATVVCLRLIPTRRLVSYWLRGNFLYRSFCYGWRLFRDRSLLNRRRLFDNRGFLNGRLLNWSFFDGRNVFGGLLHHRFALSIILRECGGN